MVGDIKLQKSCLQPESSLCDTMSLHASYTTFSKGLFAVVVLLVCYAGLIALGEGVLNFFVCLECQK